MKILTGLWNKDKKYAFDSAVMCCWRKTSILPISWDTHINNTVGSRPVPQKDKKYQNKTTIYYVILCLSCKRGGGLVCESTELIPTVVEDPNLFNKEELKQIV